MAAKMTDAKTKLKETARTASSGWTPFPIIIGILLDKPSNSPGWKKEQNV